MLNLCSCSEGTKIFSILFENNLVLRTSQQSLVNGAWAFLQPVAALILTHPGAHGPASILERSGFGSWCAT